MLNAVRVWVKSNTNLDRAYGGNVDTFGDELQHLRPWKLQAALEFVSCSPSVSLENQGCWRSPCWLTFEDQTVLLSILYAHDAVSWVL